MHMYTYTCRIHIDAIIKTSEDFFKKYIPLTLLKGLCVRGSWRLNKDCNILTSPAPPDIAVLLDCSTAGLGALSAGCCSLYRILSLTHLFSKLTDFLSSPSYIIVQSLTQYLPITGHRNVSLLPSLEWHVWSSSSGHNCHAVHSSLSSGASVCDCTAGFYLVPYGQPSPPTRFLPITGHQNVSLPPFWNGMFGRVEGQYTTTPFDCISWISYLIKFLR